MRRLLPLLFAFTFIIACDTHGEKGIEFQGVTVESRGDATVTVENGALVVTGLDGSRSGGFTVDGTPARVDVEIDPLTIPARARFGIEVEDPDGNPIVSFFNVGTGDGEIDFVFDFASPDVYGALVTYKLGGENGQVVFSGFIDILGSSSTARVQLGAGKGSGSTTSTHVIRENGRYIVVSDSDNLAEARGGCSGFTATPPPTYDEPEPGVVCTDWIEVEPFFGEEGGVMPEGEVSITGQGVGSFTVRELDSTEEEPGQTF